MEPTNCKSLKIVLSSFFLAYIVLSERSAAIFFPSINKNLNLDPRVSRNPELNSEIRDPSC